ncbi:MAG: molybdopterin-synthase adenylyltransferase MoeB [Pseudomonadota bacterium]
MTVLSAEERERYARQTILPGFGDAHQEALKAARVLVIGAGGLGSPCLIALAAAGVGTLGIIDDDRVALSNLARQTIHETDAVGDLKVESASRSLARINPHVAVEAHAVRLKRENAGDLVETYDIVVDGTDSFASRTAVADVCAKVRRPLISAAVSRFEGTLTTLMPYTGAPDFADLYPDPPSSWEAGCAEEGVLGAVTQMLGAMQAAETIKVLLAERGLPLGATLVGRLLIVDALNWRTRTVSYGRRAA